MHGLKHNEINLLIRINTVLITQCINVLRYEYDIKKNNKLLIIQHLKEGANEDGFGTYTMYIIHIGAAAFIRQFQGSPLVFVLF